MNTETKPLPTAILASLRFWLGLLGLGFLISLILYQGAAEVTGAVLSLKWGLLFVTLFHTVPLLINSVAWLWLLPGPDTPRLHKLVLYRWISGSINTLLPVAQIGGEFIRARLLGRLLDNGTLAGATVLVDFTVTLIAQLAFTLIGFGLLLSRGNDVNFATGILVLLLVATLLIFGFYFVQRRGLFQVGTRFLRKLIVTRHWNTISGNAVAFDSAVKSNYAHRGRVVVSGSIHLLAWLVGSAETWLICFLLGQPVSIVDAVIIESIAYAARSLGFLVPGALGVVEGAVVITGAVLGMDPATGLALSLAKRFRELCAGIPGISVWWWMETRQSHNANQVNSCSRH
jgi:putative membrane protein